SAVLVGIAAIVGSLIPLVPFMVIGSSIFVGAIVSLAVSTLALFAIGWWKARTTIGRPTRSGVQMAIIGIASAVAGFGIAYLVSGGKIGRASCREGVERVRCEWTLRRSNW